jgi:hypothetical protein
MYIAGLKYIDLMHARGAILLDTEMVLGDNYLRYVGQADNMWLMYNKDKTDVGIVVTDWKTNQPKQFEVFPYTKPMLPPFNEYPDNSLHHYFTQLPLYGRLLLRMLNDTKYGHIKMFGGVVVSLREDSSFVEYKVPTYFNQTIMNLDMQNYLL